MDMEVLKNALETYGVMKQLTVAIEELSELTKEICKQIRYDHSNIEEEIADVKIMIAQLELMFSKPLIEAWEENKIQRLKARLEEDMTSGHRLK